jgi:hypothetical protein
MRRSLFAAILVAGCGRGQKPAGAAGDSVPSSLGAAAPGQFSDLAPGDTAGVISMMRDLMRGIDGVTPQLTARDTTVATDSVVHHYALWLQDGVPRKLVASDSAVAGGNNNETSVWFLGGDVAVVLQLTNAYAFDGGRIVLWTDEALQPRPDPTTDLLMARQAALVDSVGGWLKLFGLQLP